MNLKNIKKQQTEEVANKEVIKELKKYVESLKSYEESKWINNHEDIMKSVKFLGEWMEHDREDGYESDESITNFLEKYYDEYARYLVAKSILEKLGEIK